MKKLKNLLKKRIVILDGATGTELQRRGMPAGAIPEMWCLDNPKVISSIHSEYAGVGSDIIYSCTFGANRFKLKRSGQNVRKINKELALIARRGAGRRKKAAIVAGGIGPLGKFIEPFGPLPFEDAVGAFKEQVRGLLDGGVDIFVVETMADIQEARAALLAVKELSGKFAMVTMTYEKDGRTLGGTDAACAVITLQSLGAGGVGCNCSMGPLAMLDLIKAMKPYSYVPLIAKPNAGMPQLIDGNTVFDMTPRRFAELAVNFVACGANMLGGCCGTTPAHIQELRVKVKKSKSVSPLCSSLSAITSARKKLTLSLDTPLKIVGESINPTGKKDLAAQLRKGNMALVRRLASGQAHAGAAALDVNVGCSGVDEPALLTEVVKLLSLNNDLPLVIDSSNSQAVERALRVYPGRALINSISAERSKSRRLLNIAAKYGAMFILLPLGGKRIPHTLEKRRKIIEQVLKQAYGLGFSNDDIVVDAMVMSLSSQPQAAGAVLGTIGWVRKKLKCNTIIGLSNISFGLPARGTLNSVFLAAARAAGLTMAIAKPTDPQVIDAKRALDLLTNNDPDALKYIAHFKDVKSPGLPPQALSSQDRVYEAIVQGSRRDIKDIVEEACRSGYPADKLVSEIMVPAINKVGDLFDKKEYFLPQLIASAETMKIACRHLEPRLKKSGAVPIKKTVVILATVKGDIHDIGKNIVALMIKNHGFNVVDLGSDVSSERIVEEVKRHGTAIVGLSALMTTTMVNMEEVIKRCVKENVDCRFVVGGAVVTMSYARSIGAEYAANGVDAVRVIKNMESK